MIICSLVFISACKKRSPSDTITIGTQEAMIVNNYNRLIVRDFFFTAFEIDVNNDNNPDYRLCNYNLTGPALGCGPAYMLSINCLHQNAEILSFLKTDTMYQNITYDTIDNGSIVKIYLKNRRSCSKMGINDSIVEIWDQHKVEAKYYGQEIHSTDYFAIDSITLTRSSTGCIPTIISQNQDTILYGQMIWYYNECNSLPENKEIYLGIKADGKLGWIKITVMEEYNLMLYESAIEK